MSGGTVSSGITASEGLLEAWAAALASTSFRLLSVKIEGENLVQAALKKVEGSTEEDFNQLGNVVETDAAEYLLYRLEPTPDSSWVFYSFVPDSAPVRQKMLYASTRSTLLKSLGDARFSTSIFATDKSDLTYASYLAHLAHHESAAPLTAREQEMADIRAAEAATVNLEPSSHTARSMTGVSVGLEWTDEAKELVARLGAEEASDGMVARLEIDTKKEVVIASSAQPGTLELPPSLPCYTFYRHSGVVVFIYSCPSTSPVKSRLIYSSSSGGVVSTAKALGVTVGKKIETSSPEEVDDAYVAAELGETPSAAADGPSVAAPLPVDERAAFSRPSRPGRKR